MRRAALASGLGILLLSSCTKSAPSRRAQSADESKPAVTSSEPAASATPEPPHAEAAAPSTSDTATRDAPPERRLRLPSDAAFLTTPLPARAPDRYATWRQLERIDVGQSHLTEVDRLPSGRLLALSQAEGKVRIYEPGSGRLLARHDVPHFQEFEPIAVLAWPDAPDRFLVGTPRGLYLHQVDGGGLLAAIDERAIWKLRWSADRRILMVLGPGQGGYASVLRFFERSGLTLEELGEIPFVERVDAWDLSRDNRLLALAHHPSGLLRVLDLERTGNQEIHGGAAPRYAGDLALSPDGRYLAVAGDGLLVLDLVNPQRAAFYSYVKNNMGHVRFAPSGDAVAASSYDGQTRIFRITDGPSGSLTLELEKELPHSGQANVYAFVFSDDGNQLASVSGDRTIRTFGAGTSRRSGAPPPMDAANVFRDLGTWRKLDPNAAKTLSSPSPRREDGQLVLDSETAPPRPSRVAVGTYGCKITLIYKLRKCAVTRDADGRTHLEFAEDNLLHLGGILWDDGSAIRFEAKLLTPSTIVECPGCELQPMHGVLRGTRGKYQGILTFRKYYDAHVPPPRPPLDVQIEEANDRFPLVLEYQGPLEAMRSEE